MTFGRVESVIKGILIGIAFPHTFAIGIFMERTWLCTGGVLIG